MRIKLLLLLLIVAGCMPDRNDGEITVIDVHKGTVGVSLQTNDLPQEIDEGEEVHLALEITNEGAYATTGLLKLTPEREFMVFSDGTDFKSEQISFRGKSNADPTDDYVIKTYTLKSKLIEDNAEYQEASTDIYFCYEYVTNADTEACLDTDPYGSQSIEKVCEAKDISLSGGQGGPIVIDRIEQEMILDGDWIRPEFTFHISNRGEGTAVMPGSAYPVCTNVPLGSNVYNRVRLTDIQFSQFTMEDFDCKTTTIDLNEQSPSLTCKMHAGKINKQDSSFQTSLRAKFAYGYIEHFETDEIKINNVG